MKPFLKEYVQNQHHHQVHEKATRLFNKNSQLQFTTFTTIFNNKIHSFIYYIKYIYNLQDCQEHDNIQRNFTFKHFIRKYMNKQPHY